jgi:iron complex outermembrane recepter protein
MNISFASCIRCTATFLFLFPFAREEAQAQSIGTAAQVEANGAVEAEGLPDIVVTAQKRSENARDVPISITAATGETLGALAVANVQDFATLTPGFFSQSPGNATITTLSLRGIGQRDIGIHNEGAVALFVDGAYVSFGQAVGQPIFDVERVEILKGPQSTLFGRNATGGLINVISKRPTSVMDGYLSAQYGSYQEIQLEGALGGPITNGVSTRASVQYTRANGYIKNDNGPDLTANNSLAARLQVELAPSDNLKVLLSARIWRMFDQPGVGFSARPYIQASDGSIRRPSSEAEYAAFCANLNPISAPPTDAWLAGNCFVSQPDPLRGSFTPQTRLSNNYKDFSGTLNWEIGDHLELTSITDYQNSNNYYDADIANTPTPIFNYVIDGRDSKQFSQEIRISGDSQSFKWVAGIYYLNIHHSIQTVTDLYNHPGFGIRLLSDFIQDTKSVSAFAQIDWEFVPTLTFSLGGRYIRDSKSLNNISICEANPIAPDGLCDYLGTVVFPDALAFNRTYDGDIKQDNWSGRVAIRYNPHRNLTLYSSITRGVKGAGFNSGAAEFYPLSAVPFKSETLYSYEAGIKASLLDRHLILDSSFFYYDYNNYQAYSGSTDGGLRTLNVDATVKGVELAITALLTSRLTLTFSGAFLDTIQKNVPLADGAFGRYQIPDAPKYSGNASINYSIPLRSRDNLSIRLSGTYIGTRSVSAIDVAQQRALPTMKLDGRVSYSFKDGEIILSAFANNITNAKIVTGRVDFTTVTGGTVDSFGRPRWYGVSAKLKF